MKIPHRLPSSIRKREKGGIDRGGRGAKVQRAYRGAFQEVKG